jgi:ubiquinone/menaquinone biosynthesis C-methylase UbiE
VASYSAIDCVGQYLFAAHLVNEHLAPYKHGIHTLVDFGCGAGKSTRAVASSVDPGGRIIGVDISGDFLAVARVITERLPLSAEYNFEFYCTIADGNRERIPLDDGIANAVIIMIVLQEFQTESLLRSALIELGRIATSGAVLAAVCVSDRITCEDYTTFTYAPFPDNAAKVDNVRKCKSTLSSIIWESDRHWSREILVDGFRNAGWKNLKAEYPLAPTDLQPFPSMPEISWLDETRIPPFLFISGIKEK